MTKCPDGVEKALNTAVCSGTMTLQEAQHAETDELGDVVLDPVRC